MASTGAARVGIIGGSGYAGAELLRLCAGHPGLEVVWATGDTQAGNRIAGLYPSLAGHYGATAFAAYDAVDTDDVDLVFCALPHGESQKVVPRLLGEASRAPKVVDLAADFRLRDAALYPRWYHDEHTAPDLLGRFAYGLPELFRDDVAKADLVAAPGCYPTAAGLALAPLTRDDLVDTTATPIVVDAASGVSGAGRAPKHATHFGTANEDFTAYGRLDHRHTPEIELIVGGQVLFTPHLAPMTRGILATCYARPATTTSTAELLDALHAAYDGEPFVVVRDATDASPSTKATWGSNSAHVTARYDERTGWVVAIAAIDNLVKGASGQAVQCANIVLGLDETAGLSTIGVYP